MEPLLNNISAETKKVFNIISALGKREQVAVYVVGGFVRDLILNHEVEDIDIMVEGDAIRFAKKFRTENGGSKVVSYGRFGTAMLNFKRFKLEFASAREEYYDPQSRKPLVKMTDIKSDLSRRDFTINAMAISLNEKNYGELLDPFDGQKDVLNQKIKTPLDPEVTFYDDPLRMLRAIRFASRLNFKIVPEVASSIRRMASRLKIVSQERITDEFLKMLNHKRPSVAVELLQKYGLLEIILPELLKLSDIEYTTPGIKKNLLDISCSVLQTMSEQTEDLEIRLASLMINISGKINPEDYAEDIQGRMIWIELGKKMKLPMKMVERIAMIIYFQPAIRHLVFSTAVPTKPEIRRLLIEAGELFDSALLIASALERILNPEKNDRLDEHLALVMGKIAEAESEEDWKHFKLAVSGEEIMDIYRITEGIKVGEIKQILTARIISGTIPNTRKDCVELLNKLKSENW